MRLFSKHRQAIKPLDIAPISAGQETEAAEQDNTPGPDDKTFEQIEQEEARNTHRFGFSNFGR